MWQWEMIMERAYYEILNTCSHKRVTAVTILEGEQKGKKFLFCGGRQLYPEGELYPEGAGQRFTEEMGQPPVCVICGAGHVGLPVTYLAKFAGFETIVIEDRPTFADAARRAGAKQVICDSFSHGLSQIEGGEESYFVVMTRGHRYDEECLREILKKPAAYIGMMASKGRAARMKNLLLETGEKKERIEEIHTPIGLSIHARTPEEIAVSVIAEMIEVKNLRKEVSVFDRDILERILGKSDDSLWVLATIIRRNGSAPRDVGTKMLITDYGESVGSIGGGCMEAEIIRRALAFREEIPREAVAIVTAALSGADAEDEGMVCGGKIEVLLEGVR